MGGFLPDLNQSHPFVRNYFLKWIKDYIQEYDFDAIRIDAALHVDKAF